VFAHPYIRRHVELGLAEDHVVATDGAADLPSLGLYRNRKQLLLPLISLSTLVKLRDLEEGRIKDDPGVVCRDFLVFRLAGGHWGQYLPGLASAKLHDNIRVVELR